MPILTKTATRTLAIIAAAGMLSPRVIRMARDAEVQQCNDATDYVPAPLTGDEFKRMIPKKTKSRKGKGERARRRAQWSRNV